MPVKSLNLPAEFTYDAYDRKIDYTVALCGATVKAPAAPTAPPARFTGWSATARTNGHSGFTRAGVRASSGSTDPDELQNCHYDRIAADTPFTHVFTQLTASATFDDVVRFKERAKLMTEEDHYAPPTEPCEWKPGFTVSGSRSARCL